MAGKLREFIKRSKSRKEEEVAKEREAFQQAMDLVPRCELNEDLPQDADQEQLWKAIQKKFRWTFGPAKGKSLKDTKGQFIRWAVRKLKDPVKVICTIEWMVREKKSLEEIMTLQQEAQKAADEQAAAEKAAAEQAAAEKAAAENADQKAASDQMGSAVSTTDVSPAAEATADTQCESTNSEDVSQPDESAAPNVTPKIASGE